MISKAQIKKKIKSPLSVVKRSLLKQLPDSIYLRLMYRKAFGKRLNLSNPQTFNEKLQWLKLHDRKPIYTTMVDKYLAKQYVADVIGPQYVIPTLGVWERAEDIDFDKLPDQFVLKCTHDSGSVIICKDKKSLNIDETIKKLNAALRTNFYWSGREWPYKNVKPRIIAEEYLEDKTTPVNGLIDYKFYCFNGKPQFLYCGFANIIDGQKHDLLSFYDLDWQPAPFYRTDYDPLPFLVGKPENLNEMIRISEMLSKDIPFLRVDLYNINGQAFFSELTFAPGSGYGAFSPPEWENRIGEMITLSKALR